MKCHACGRTMMKKFKMVLVNMMTGDEYSFHKNCGRRTIEGNIFVWREK